MSRPPRFADAILKRVLPPGKHGDSILGDLHEEFSRVPGAGSRFPSAWYWRETLRLVIRYGPPHSPHRPLSYPRSTPMWFDLRGDLRTALRMMQRNPGTSSLIVATLAVAIGVSTIGFAFADLALFRGLPVDDHAKVVSMRATDPHGVTLRGRVSAPDLLDYRARSTSLEHLAGMHDGSIALIRNGQSLTLVANYATANLFAAMGQTALAGRLFNDGEDRPGAAPVALLSHHYWRDHMDGGADAIGKTLQIGRDLVTIVGVLKPELEFGNLAEIDIWLPKQLNPDGPRDVRNLRFIGRLRDGVTFDEAAAELAAIGDTLAIEHPDTNAGWKVRLMPVRDLTGDEGLWVVIFLFLFAIAVLIAIATANVSNLIMVRAAARARELAVRTAMGAKGGRLLRQFLIEGAVLSLLGALLSIPTAWIGLQVIGSVSPDPVFQQVVIDWHELSFVTSLALICPIAFSLSSARLIVRPDLREVLSSQGGRGSTARMRGRGVLVVAQVALAVIMLTASSLAAKSIRATFEQPLGMNIERLLIFGMEFNDALYPDLSSADAAAAATREALRAVPGVTRVTNVSSLPVLGDRGMTAISVDDRTVPAGEATPMAVVTAIRADAGTVLGIGLRGGRWWNEGAVTEAVISETAATRYFDGVDRALGRYFSVQEGDTRQDYQVAGVSTDVANTDRTERPPARIWVPMRSPLRRTTFLVEAQHPAALAGHVRSVAAAVAPAVPIEYLQTFDEAMRLAETSDYLIIAMLAGFAIVALVLATSGLFGVVSYSVAQRTPEFGTRIALGAGAWDVIGIVVRQSLKLVAIGLIIGLTGGIAVGFMMGSLLFGTSPADPATIAGVAVILTVVSLAATAWPAWRASRVDPVIALRSE